MSTHWRRMVAVAATLGFLLVLWAIVRNSGLQTTFADREHIAIWARAQGLWAPLAIVLLQIAQVLLAPIPGQVVGVAAGYLFGAPLGTFYSLLGTGVGSWIALSLARAYGRPLVERLVPQQTLAWLDAGAQRRGLFFFVLVFLLPFLPDDLACLAGGLTRIPIPALVAVAVTGRIPGLVVSSWLGANTEGLSVAQWVVLIVASILLAALFLLYGERLQQRLIEHASGTKTQPTSRPPSPAV